MEQQRVRSTTYYDFFFSTNPFIFCIARRFGRRLQPIFRHRPKSRAIQKINGFVEKKIISYTSYTLLILQMIYYWFVKWNKVFKNWPSEICGLPPLKIWSDMMCLGRLSSTNFFWFITLLYTLSQIENTFEAQNYVLLVFYFRMCIYRCY